MKQSLWQIVVGFILAAQLAIGGEVTPEQIQVIKLDAEKGVAQSQCVLGNMYAGGQGVPKDDAVAAMWFRKAAEQGNANAQVILGNCYLAGQGVPKDDAMAVMWYRKAAELGFARAQVILGNCYSTGQVVPRDDTLAFMWFRKAAEQGDAGVNAVTFRSDTLVHAAFLEVFLNLQRPYCDRHFR